MMIYNEWVGYYPRSVVVEKEVGVEPYIRIIDLLEYSDINSLLAKPKPNHLLLHYSIKRVKHYTTTVQKL